MKLTDYSNNKFSQYGEDGIIEKIFSIIEPKSRTCIEFGAWDGFHYSNTANLWTNGWSGILIEADQEKANLLRENVKQYNCQAICRFVGITSGNTLEDILKDNNIHDEIDLLSIDIDGDDYHVFASLDTLRPRVIICEYNNTIPHWMDIHQAPGEYFGSSIAALNRIALEKGYKLISVTSGNCFFVSESEFYKFNNYLTNINEIALNDYINYVITDYAGNYLVSGSFPFGINKKLSCNTIYSYDQIKHNSDLSICNTGSLRTIIKFLYYDIIRPIFSSNK